MALVNDHKVVVAPVDCGKINIAAFAALAGKIGVVKNVVMEAVSGKQVAPIIQGINAPVFPQFLRSQHQNPVITQLIVFDDCQSRKGLTEAHAVRQNAAAELLNFFNDADGAVFLELIELVPDLRFLDTCTGFHDMIFRQLVQILIEDMIEGNKVNELRRVLFNKAPVPGAEPHP